MKKVLGVAFSLGWIIVTNLCVFIYLGKYLDGKWGTFPLFILIGILLSFVSIGISLYHIWKQLDPNQLEKQAEETS